MGQGESAVPTCSSSDCRSFSSSDPASDTVSIDQAALQASLHSVVDSEAVTLEEQRVRAAWSEAAVVAEAPASAAPAVRPQDAASADPLPPCSEAEAQRRVEAVQRIAAAVDRGLAVAAAKAEARWQRGEAEALEARARREAQARRDAASQAARAAARQELEREAAARSEQERLEVAAFLEGHGFSAVGAPRSRLLQQTYPLHEAVRQNNPKMVRLLLAAGAEPTVRNSADQTPQQLAKKLMKGKSHSEVLQALTEPRKSGSADLDFIIKLIHVCGTQQRQDISRAGR